MTRYGQTMAEALQGINEKLKPSDGAGAYVKDFRKSDAPQFKGKSDKQLQKMAVAAYLDDKEENMKLGDNESVNEKMMKGFVVRYTDKNGERLAVPYKTRDRAKEEVKALKKLGAKDIEITTHNLNFKEDKDMEEKFKPEGGELFVVTAGPGDNAQKVIGMDKNLRKAQKMRDDYDRKNRPSKPSHKARVYAQSRASQPRNKFKIGQDISYSEFGNKLQFTKVNEVAPVAMALGRTAAKAAGAAAGTAVANKVMGKEGFASDAQRKAAFAQGYKAKGKKEEKSKFEAYTGVPNPRTEGRKSNYATDDEDEEGANKNIIMQLYKAISLRGRFDVVFDDGKKEKVKEPIAQKAIAIHRTFKTSRDRLAFQNKISKSYRDLLNAIR